jgi:hypothetical protein
MDWVTGQHMPARFPSTHPRNWWECAFSMAEVIMHETVYRNPTVLSTAGLTQLLPALEYQPLCLKYSFRSMSFVMLSFHGHIPSRETYAGHVLLSFVISMLFCLQEAVYKCQDVPLPKSRSSCSSDHFSKSFF